MNNSSAIGTCTDKIIFSSLYIAFQIVNIVFNTLTIYQLTKIYKNAGINKCLHNFATNLLISDVAYFVVYIIGCFSQLFTCSAVLGDVGTTVLGFFNTCTFISVSTSILLISLNRYFVICSSNVNKMVFKDKLTLYYCGITWLTGPLILILNHLIGCHPKFIEDNPSFIVKCHSPDVITALTPHSIYVYVCAYGLLIFYFMCIKKLKSQAVGAVMQNIAASIYHKQMHVFWQALFIWLSLVASITSYRVLPYITGTYAKFVINIVFSFGCLYSTPIIVVCFSKKMRSNILHIFYKTDVTVVVAEVHM